MPIKKGWHRHYGQSHGGWRRPQWQPRPYYYHPRPYIVPTYVPVYSSPTYSGWQIVGVLRAEDPSVDLSLVLEEKLVGPSMYINRAKSGGRYYMLNSVPGLPYESGQTIIIRGLEKLGPFVVQRRP